MPTWSPHTACDHLMFLHMRPAHAELCTHDMHAPLLMPQSSRHLASTPLLSPFPALPLPSPLSCLRLCSFQARSPAPRQANGHAPRRQREANSHKLGCHLLKRDAKKRVGQKPDAELLLWGGRVEGTALLCYNSAARSL